MFKSATRIAYATPLSRTVPRLHAARRFVSTAPPHQKSRSWRNSTLRWGLAGALVYYYNIASVFAEEPPYTVHAPPETSHETEQSQTVASITEQRRAQARTQPSTSSSQPQHETVATISDADPTAPGSPEALEEEASEQGAFNEETGEINWECPCLGGMAHGPCGEQFRAAFSCFVFSKDEPKGVDCIEHFKTMQNCFREHPDVYGSELDDEDEAAAADGVEAEIAPVSSEPTPVPQVALTPPSQDNDQQDLSSRSPSDIRPDSAVAVEQPSDKTATQPARVENRTADESNVQVPKAWHDSR